RHPDFEKRRVLALHDLITEIQILGDPARDITEAIRHQAAALSEAPVDRRGITLPETLDDHVEHPEKLRQPARAEKINCTLLPRSGPLDASLRDRKEEVIMASRTHVGDYDRPIVRERGLVRAEPARQAYNLLHVAYTLVPLLAGVDKFFHKLVNWDQYLSPFVLRLVKGHGHEFMLAVGVVEIVAALGVMLKP